MQTSGKCRQQRNVGGGVLLPIQGVGADSDFPFLLLAGHVRDLPVRLYFGEPGVDEEDDLACAREACHRDNEC